MRTRWNLLHPSPRISHIKRYCQHPKFGEEAHPGPKSWNFPVSDSFKGAYAAAGARHLI